MNMLLGKSSSYSTKDPAVLCPLFWWLLLLPVFLFLALYVAVAVSAPLSYLLLVMIVFGYIGFMVFVIGM